MNDFFHFQVWIKDVGREILRERRENRRLPFKESRRVGLDKRSDESKASSKRRLRSKRETFLEMLMGAVVGAGGSRRPRKIQEEGGTSNLQQEARGACYQRCKHNNDIVYTVRSRHQGTRCGGYGLGSLPQVLKDSTKYPSKIHSNFLKVLSPTNYIFSSSSTTSGWTPSTPGWSSLLQDFPILCL